MKNIVRFAGALLAGLVLSAARPAGAADLSAQRIMDLAGADPAAAAPAPRDVDMLTLLDRDRLAALGLYYALQASELRVRGLNEVHASAYVTWERAKRAEAEDRATPAQVAAALDGVESTRLDLYRERSRNARLRLDLEDRIDQEVTGELIDPPEAPEAPPPTINGAVLGRAVVARLRAAEPPVAQRRVHRAVQRVVLDLNDAWQAVIAARAALDHHAKALQGQQILYQQDRSAHLGKAMAQVTLAEAALAQASGDFLLARSRLSALAGRGAAAGLNDGILAEILAGFGIEGGGGDYTPKGGSGFGQSDQKTLYR